MTPKDPTWPVLGYFPKHPAGRKEAPQREARCGASLHVRGRSGEKSPSRPRIPCVYGLEVGGRRRTWSIGVRVPSLFRALRERRVTLGWVGNVVVAATGPRQKLPLAYLYLSSLVLHLQLLFQGGVEFPTGGKSGGAKGAPWSRRGVCDRADESATRACVGSHAG